MSKMGRKAFFSCLVMAIFAVSAGAQAQPDALKITTKPETIYVESGTSQKFVNCDFQLANQTSDKLKIESVQISVFDSKGSFVLRKVIDSHGVSPSINTVPKIEVGPNETLNLFNPFYSFEGGMELSRLDFDFGLSNEKGDRSYHQKITLKPIEYHTKTAFILPIKGRIVVEYGHDFYSPHRRIDLTNEIVRQVGLVANSARYANDLSIIDKDGNLYKGGRNQLESWFAYGAPLFAPGSGTVVTLVDGIPDNHFEKDGGVAYAKEVTREKASGLLGNYIVIDHGNGEFSLFAHLKKGSFKVKQGSHVKQGQSLAAIGFSGDADFVHTHYQLQNNADPATAEGLPIYFHNFWKIVGGKRSGVLMGAIDTGDVVMPADRKK